MYALLACRHNYTSRDLDLQLLLLVMLQLLLVLLLLVLLLRLLLWQLSRCTPLFHGRFLDAESVPGSFVYKAKGY